MPPALLGQDASMSAPRDMSKRSRETNYEPVLCPTDDEAVAPRRQKEEPALCPTDDEVIAARRKDKRSADYILRSQFAGGIAGCAVSMILWFAINADMPGQNCYCPPR